MEKSSIESPDEYPEEKPIKSIEVDEPSIDKQISDLETTNIKSKNLASKYRTSTITLRDKLESNRKEFYAAKDELFKISKLTRVKYILEEFFGKENPEKIKKLQVDKIKQDVKLLNDYFLQRTARSEKHGRLLNEKIDSEYNKIINSPEAKDFLEYSNYKPSTDEGKLDHLKALRDFIVFYSKLKKTLKKFSNKDAERIEKSIFEMFFPINSRELRPYIPNPDEIDKAIIKINQKYRGPQYKEPEPFDQGENKYGRYVFVPENIILVHKTDYLPSQQRIKTLGNATHNDDDYHSEKFLPIQATRQTVHFSLNHPVASHLMGNWDNKKYALLVPAEGLMKKNIITVNTSDTFTLGDVPLKGKDAELIISRDVYMTLSPREIARLKRRTGVDVVTVPDNGEEMDEAINRRIRENGYVSLSSNQYGNVLMGEGEALSEAVGRMAIGEGKSTDLHIGTPFKRLESSTSSIAMDQETNHSMGTYYSGESVLNGAKEALAQARKDLIKARGGEQNLTTEDIRTLKKLEKVVENYKYAETKQARTQPPTSDKV
jgi:hypothetical protein